MSDDTSRIEKQLESIVLDKYDLLPGDTVWHAHDRVGPDDMVHYFSRNNERYALVWNDFPNTTFIHEEQLPLVHIKAGNDEWLHIKTGDLAGYYSLYQDPFPPKLSRRLTA